MPRKSPQRLSTQEQEAQNKTIRSPSCPNFPRNSQLSSGVSEHSSRLEFIAAPGARARTRSPVIAMVQNRITHQLQALNGSTSSSLAARAAREERDKELETLRSRKTTIYGTIEKSSSADSKENRLTALREGFILTAFAFCLQVQSVF